MNKLKKIVYYIGVWRIHVDVWQNQDNIVKLKKKTHKTGISKGNSSKEMYRVGIVVIVLDTLAIISR